MFFNSTTVVGDYENGKIYEFDLNVYADDGAPQKWLRQSGDSVTKTVPSDSESGANVVSSVQLRQENGVF